MKFTFALFLVFFSPWLLAGEGMWIPLLVEKKIITDMQAAGCRLSASDIYSISQACLKDAVVLFGSGCTGEIISPDGLLITNHHCGYGRIQAHSTVEKDLLTDGFWAYSRDQELPNPGLTVSFLVSMEDVTDKVLDGVTSDLTLKQRATVTDSNISAIIARAVKDTHFEAEVESFYFGSHYFLFTYEVFSDVRLVGTPPSSIGKFGGDTDNWVWPRHTGDFCLFRVYAGKDNKPADYAVENVPYHPKKFLTISSRGVQEGDFTMVMGYPARTDQYLHAEGLAVIAEDILPARIKMREDRLRIMSAEMSKSPEVSLQYAAKYQGTSNAWKKWIGVVEGVERTAAIQNKIKREKSLTDSAFADIQKIACFTPVLQRLSDFYADNKAGVIAVDLALEAMNSFELIQFARQFTAEALSGLAQDTAERFIIKEQLNKMADSFFKNTNLTIDRRIMPLILDTYFKSTETTFQPEIFHQIHNRFKGNVTSYSDWLFKKSLFTHPAKMSRITAHLSVRTVNRLLSDPASQLHQSFSAIFFPYYRISDSLDLALQGLYREYVSGLMQYDTNRLFYPDANFTMRVSYGKAEGYEPADAVIFDFQTTAQGIPEKAKQDVPDYAANPKLIRLIEEKDFGNFVTDSAMPVCFIASNHTSGGNSGSPVLDAEGRLIGINFDRNWEGTISDYEYDPAVCRNISLDIRYVLFIIDKYAGAVNILNELNIE